MNIERAFAPIKLLVNIAMALHIAGLVAVAAVTAAQIPLGSLLQYRHPDEILFVLPAPLALAEIIIILTLHICLTLGFRAGLNGNRVKLEVTTIFAFVFVLVAAPALSHFALLFGNALASLDGMDNLMAHIILRTLMSYALMLRGLGLSALFAAASMTFYFRYITKKQQEV